MTAATAIASGLRRRLLFMLIAPLLLLALLNAWVDYRSAEGQLARQDALLLALVPLLADSVVAQGAGPGQPPVLAPAPALQEFLIDGAGQTAYAIVDADGEVLHGAGWLAALPPATAEPQFHNQEYGGTSWRIVRQRQETVAGQLVVTLAEGTDPRQQWARAVLLKVLLPHLVLLLAAALAVNWAVRRALRPLLQLRDDVERRSPRDLDALDADASPEEVRPLVRSLNRLFSLVNAQADSQRRFIADAAHQLRTPLAGLQAQVEAWAQAANSAGTPGQEGTLTLRAGQVNQLRSASRRTAQLANQLLALARADATMQVQPMAPVDLRALCESLLEAHLDAASARQIDLGLDAAPATATGNDWLLRELLANLVDNAVRYTPAGGTVTIRCGRRDGQPVLEVEDDGPGVAPEELPRILERFYRVRGTPGDGTGLGLAIAQDIAHVHQGRLELRPGAGGRGLRATLWLPG